MRAALQKAGECTDFAASPERVFWDWFVEHEEMLWDLEDEPDPAFHALLAAMERVDKDLALDVGRKHGGRRELIVSASGDLALFAAVVRLVEAAPPLERWTVRAFRQRRPLVGELVLGGVTVRLREVRFAAQPAGGRLDVRIFIPGYRWTPLHEFVHAAAVLLETVLGEFDAETRIGRVHVGPPQPHVRSQPLSELPDLVDALTGN
ncbi:hypothetical protein [Longimicrobium sp.]|uniref:hypothetical protein n=1 Tax=Longimicrobium sp. TaxID=2029185 RepID=UPI002E2FCB66|nr:hypothetical protein [Longimicrobium sp.]HEX6042246.1 hypothetical protein [Longimicrobium sp.]